ncbi:hypothetical protein F4825DRAFT_400682 [Nemania diffusa]|nr:hypothetical protein F4825DRAFT_400682 [Nemania diffusa]
MDHQESSPLRQRQHVLHHRHQHRHRHCHNNDAAAQTANCKSALGLGRLSRESHAPDSHVIVESWLEKVTAPVPTAQMGLRESRNQKLHHRKRPRSKDRHASPCRPHAKRVDPLWRPQHIPPAQGSSPRLPLIPTRNPKRYRRDSEDSSLISDLTPRRKSRGRSYIKPASEHGEGSHYKPLDEAEVGAADALSSTSHVDVVRPFEKRRRYKTRVDKYDIKKSGGRRKSEKIPEQDEDRPRKSKSGKRRHIATGKDVMNNFTSEAVLNNRITVQPNLKPGLFNNKRVSKKAPITDLSFSEMPLPTNQERDSQRQKGLSSSRLREVQRESRELEHISSFFLPTSADATSRRDRPVKSKRNEEARCKKMPSRDKAASFTTPSSPTAITQPCSIPTTTPSNPHCRSGSSRTTTYFTWSSTQHSPEVRNSPVGPQTKSTEPIRSATPDNIRKALVATGVYNISKDQHRHDLKTPNESSSTCSNIVDHVDTYEEGTSTVDQESKIKSKCCNDTTSTVAPLARLEARWNTILPPEWRLRRSEDEISSIGEQRQETILDIPARVRSPSRQGVLQEVRIKPTREYPRAQHACCHRAQDFDPNLQPMAENYVPVAPEPNRAVDQTTPDVQDRGTISSRDAMPPPPLPTPQPNSLHLNSNRSGGNPSSSIHLGATRPLETHIQVPNCDHPQVMDTCKATGQPCEMSRNPEKMIPTLNSTSWISQAITSSIANYERDKTLSRLSMRSPIYATRSRENTPQGAVCSTPPPAAPMRESMADFIARIESELEEPTSLNEPYNPESMTGYQELYVDPIMSTYNAHDRQVITPDGLRTDRRHLPSDITDPIFKETFETGQSFDGDEVPALSSICRHASIPLPTEAPEDNMDEFLEMSKFWRPNRFSHF